MNRKTRFVTVFTGAGVSAESGIQTFRASDGTWNNHRVEDVASPQGFLRNPQLVWDFYRGRWEQRQTVKPNAAHYAIAELEKKVEELGFTFVLITQNVDGLHQEAGSQHVLELHGDLRVLKCNVCEYHTDEREYWEDVNVPVCPQCGGYMRPNIVWFDEALDVDTITKASVAAENSIAMLMVGTSNQVFPAAHLPHMTLRGMGHLYECNPELVLAHAGSFGFQELYHPYRGVATVTVPEACNAIVRLLESLGESVK